MVATDQVEIDGLQDRTRPRIGATLAPSLSLAFHQNSVPLVRELFVDNPGDAALSDILLTIQSEPDFLTPRTWRIDRIAANARYHITDRDVGLNGGHLAKLTEAERISVVLALEADGEEHGQFAMPLDLLPRMHWSGIGHVPEMVAAFVQPNDPAIDRILK